MEPSVHGMDHRVRRVWIVAKSFLHETGKGGEHQRPIEVLGVHEFEPGSGLSKRRQAVDGAAHDLAVRSALWVPVAEVVLLRTRGGDAVKGRIRDVVADLTPDHDLGAPIDFHVPDRAAVRLGQELSECLLGLVEMVVRVKDAALEQSAIHVSPEMRMR
jgi:hypothetical protein